MAGKPLKDTVRDFLRDRNLEAVAELATRHKRVLGSLVALTFDDDPLRMLRVFRLAAVLGFRVHPKTYRTIERHSA